MKKFFSKIGIFTVASAMTVASAFAFTACDDTPEPVVEEPHPALLADGSYSLDFSCYQSGWELNTENGVSFYSLLNVVYCANPTKVDYQCINFYVPAAYLNADGTVNPSGTAGLYTAETAPIIYINSVGGYAGKSPYKIGENLTQLGRNKWEYSYLEHGFIIAFVGERGINTYEDADTMTNLGVAPISLVDLKAGIRFLRHNAELIPGDTDKIISNGMSAGGAMSTLISTTGNTSLFDSYLETIGAVMDEPDDVYACMAYCPIIDLEDADLAYEWMWNQDTNYSTRTDFTDALSAKLAEKYVAYIASLDLVDRDGTPLTLNEDASKSGDLYDWLVAQYEASFNEYIAQGNAATDATTYDWLTYDAANGAQLVTPSGYDSAVDALILSGYNARSKACVAFDGLTYGGDNGVFGEPLAKYGSAESFRHFSVVVTEAIEELKDEFPAEYAAYYQAYYADAANPVVQEMVDWYNPYGYVLREETDICQYFRICVGTQDSDTAPLVSGVFALLLEKAGYDVDYNLIWNMGHTDADYAGALEAWVDSICG